MRGAGRLGFFVSIAAASGCGSSTDLVIGHDAVSISPGGSGAAGDPAGASSGAGNASGGVPGGAGLEVSAGVGAGVSVAGAVQGSAGAGASADTAGAAGMASAGAPSCAVTDVAPVGSLRHRYSFDGTGIGPGVAIKDLVGIADGQVKEAPPPPAPAPACPAEPHPMLDGNGQLLLDGCKGYVDLPNNLFKDLTEVTIVTWQKWKGGAAFERYFDFGVGVSEDDSTGQGSSYLAVATYGLDQTKLQLLARQGPISPEESIRSFADMNDQVEHQVAAVFVSSSYAELFRDGVSLGRIAVTWPLSSINDVNEWIGRSQWANDHTFNGSVNEFRIYDRALTPCAIQALYLSGPNNP
jgi:hypothetical protein